MREEKLAQQLKEIVQKVSLPDEWRDKFLNKINEWQKDESYSSELFAQNLKNELSAVKEKISRLMDAYLEGTLDLSEFQEKKNMITEQKVTLEQKLSHFERKGNHWLELLRSWVLKSNQAKNLAREENFEGMKNFLKTISLNRRLAAGRLEIDFKKPWNYLYFLPAPVRSADFKISKTAKDRLWWR